MREIERIDAALTPLAPRLMASASVDMFTEVCLLKDMDKIDSQTYKGIYRIDIKSGGGHADFASWAAQFAREWDLEEYRKKFTCTTKIKRINRHGGPLGEWIPLYIGKSKCVGKRVREHVTLALDARTFAMKLNARPNMSGRQFRLSTVRLDVVHYDWIAPVLEKSLRDLINPIVGKQ